ncbi:MAG TPA: type II toxin-antitoxin system Phd/YefM family antitoxin [Oculatellaceae cyanobacterium]
MNFADNDKNKAAQLGLKRFSMGKTQARKQFFPLVDSLGHQHAAIEITDHDVPVAVLLSYENFVTMLSKLAMLAPQVPEPKPSLLGSIEILSDDLEAASAEIAELFHSAIEESGKALK